MPDIILAVYILVLFDSYHKLKWGVSISILQRRSLWLRKKSLTQGQKLVSGEPRFESRTNLKKSCILTDKRTFQKLSDVLTLLNRKIKFP